MKKSINVNVSQIFEWFIAGERCVMHKNSTDIPVTQINLSNDDLDKLISQGEHILEAKKEQQPKQKNCSAS